MTVGVEEEDESLKAAPKSRVPSRVRRRRCSFRCSLSLSHSSAPVHVLLAFNFCFPTLTSPTGKSKSPFFGFPSPLPPSPCRKRALILDYLVQRCYTRTARAFAVDSTIRHLDADGDEIRCPRGEEDSSGVTEDVLRQADLRQGTCSYRAMHSPSHLWMQPV